MSVPFICRCRVAGLPPAHERLSGPTVPLSTGGHDRPVPVASDTVSNPLLFVAYASMPDSFVRVSEFHARWGYQDS